MYRAIISKYALDLGMTGTMAGVVAGVLSIAALFSRPVAGRILGPFGISKKKILMGAVAGSLFIVEQLYTCQRLYPPCRSAYT